ncbi:MAG: hypothetical protein LBC23_02470, partial [Coriobacteriales bacterium]|nr:hypothetical protein [Coriobacteriales bacterium]
MRYTVEHQIPGRVRVCLRGRIPAADACALSALIEAWDGVRGCVIYPRTGSIAITHEETGEAAGGKMGVRILKQLDRLTLTEVVAQRPSESHLQAQAYRFEPTLWEQIVGLLVRRVVVRLLLPLPLRFIYQVFCALSFLREAFRSLVRGRLDVPVLDAAAIASSLVQGKADEAGSTMFLLTVGEMMENHARDRTQLELIHSLLEVPERVWLLAPRSKESGGEGRGAQTAARSKSEETLVEAATLRPGDLIIVRTGSPIPVDGVVQSGLALVNQNSLTGEPLPIERSAEDTVFAGTVVEEGELVIEVSAT